MPNPNPSPTTNPKPTNTRGVVIWRGSEFGTKPVLAAIILSQTLHSVLLALSLVKHSYTFDLFHCCQLRKVAKAFPKSR